MLCFEAEACVYHCQDAPSTALVLAFAGISLALALPLDVAPHSVVAREHGR
jgi:hypothetical protein